MTRKLVGFAAALAIGLLISGIVTGCNGTDSSGSADRSAEPDVSASPVGPVVKPPVEPPPPPPPADACQEIVYVIDKSGSMFDKFAYVQYELKEAIAGLESTDQFHVIFFTDRAFELSINGEVRLHEATTAAKSAAADWIDRQVGGSASGITDPREALERAFKVAGGPPDVIVFLTDGLFPAGTEQTIRRLNPGRKVRIDTIALVNRDSEDQLKRIAVDNGGKYMFISESELKQDH